MWIIVLRSARHGDTVAFFFFNDTATTEIYTLSLHDALPISERPVGPEERADQGEPDEGDRDVDPEDPPPGERVVDVGGEQRGGRPGRVSEDAIEADRHEDGPVELLVQGRAAHDDDHPLADALDQLRTAQGLDIDDR